MLFYQIEPPDKVAKNENDDVERQTIAELFNLIESNKQLLKLETYSLSQTSLEQVFLSFVKEQRGEDGQVDEQNENVPLPQEETDQTKPQVTLV
jgi:hypothetical protein